ncbi:outer membrane beta-barrel protein [Pseudoteredinibacter isoporae]|uniref:Outer membrane protein beta-barrel domain-containing protein n=1 Tax=Pseudoteredinibacter isoporae TaxID=570281 RepID=A0A7X0MYU1_9GAMM|nr:outer membrane beta-barrel protein [Pseudoteredinibacter isoporae]MBB6523444.1 hypothetical protein [Pseudoteredinibacter isoporae]NHO88953.1 porin family protein [Pseudoteredinibacter isoporae]NIB24339.1 porin family protein [Pseudoteredinibacter isoporae]
MFKRLVLLVASSVFCSVVSADVRPFFNADIGYADTDFDNGIYFDVGGGVQFNDHIEMEVGYNHYGDVGPYGIDVTSFSYGLNLGGKISENTRLFAVLGAERLELDDTVTVGTVRVNVDDSSTEAFYGIGAAFAKGENTDIRLKLLSHSSGDLITFSAGFAYYF